MAARYKLTYQNPMGVTQIESVSFSSLTFVRAENEVGVLTVRLPSKYNPAWFVRDGRLELYRSLNGGPYYLEGETSFLIERIRLATESSGERMIELEAADMLTLLRRRVVAYDAGSTYTDKLGFADDLMKDVITENLGVSAIDTTRNLSAYLSVDTSVSLGAAIADEISWKNVLDAITGFANASETAGVRVIFDIVKTGPNAYLFKTWKTQRGVDHSADSGQSITLSEQMGNLSNPEIVANWQEEGNYIYTLGRGEDEIRPVQEILDLTRIGASPFARCELAANEGNITDLTQLENAGNRILAANKPIVSFTGQALETTKLMYGIHYKYGDLLSAVYEGIAFDCRVKAIKIDVDSGGEKLDIRLEGEAYA